MNINEILNASFGEVENKLRVTFKKTVLIRQYETEVIEASAEVLLSREITGAERVFITALARAQIEYQVFAELYVKGTVNKEEYKNKVAIIESSMTAIKSKAESVLNKSLDNYINDIDIEVK